jgi:hypothetical protein
MPQPEIVDVDDREDGRNALLEAPTQALVVQVATPRGRLHAKRQENCTMSTRPSVLSRTRQPQKTLAADEKHRCTTLNQSSAT